MHEESDIIRELKEEEKKGRLNINSNSEEKILKSKNKKILLVDDEPGIRFSVEEGFKDIDSNYEIISVDNGKKCLEFLEKNEPPDLILLDIMMPEMDGWDTAAEIKKNYEWCNIPIIFLTAKIDNHSTNYGKIISDDYITKPFEIYDLKKRIDDALEKKIK